MDQLVPNPEGCKNFESNPFRKEKCKHCGHPWQSHKDAISEQIVAGFTKAKVAAAQAKADAEAAASAKARAAKADKKAQNAAVEDAWLFDGAQAAQVDDDSDDDMGFRMFSAQDLKAQAPAAKAPPTRQLTVKNLIDFGECDVAHSEVPASPPLPPMESAASGAQIPQGAPLDLAPTPFEQFSGAAQGGDPFSCAAAAGSSSMPAMSSGSPPMGGMVPRSSGLYGAPGGEEEELVAEIQHLRQMLNDANEEKNIQVEIIRDEVSEKQATIERLLKDKVDLEASIRRANEQVQALERDKDAMQKGSGETSQLSKQQEEEAAAKLDAAVAQERRRAMEQEESRMAEHAKVAQELERVKEQAKEHAAAASELQRVQQQAKAQEDASAGMAQELQRVKEDLQRASEQGEARAQQHATVEERLKQAREEVERDLASESAVMQKLRGELAQLQAVAASVPELERQRQALHAECQEAAARAASRENAQQAMQNVVESKPIGASLSPAVSALLAELRGLHASTRRILQEHTGDPSADAALSIANTAEDNRSLEEQLRGLKDSHALLHSAAQRLATESAEQRRRSSDSTPETLTAITAPAAPPHDANLKALEVGAAEARMARLAGRHAQHALREVRRNAERQLTWISHRIRAHRAGDNAGDPLTPTMAKEVDSTVMVR